MAAEGNEACSPCCSNSQAEETTCTRALNQAEYALCRICHCEDTIDNLDSPCNCKGSLQFVHRKCLQKWISEKLDTSRCEVCNAQYKGNYNVDRKTETGTTNYSPAFVGWLIPDEGPNSSDGTDRESRNEQQSVFCRPFFRIYLTFLIAVTVIHAILIIITRDDGDDGESSPVAFLVFNFLKGLVLFIPVLIVARIVTCVARIVSRHSHHESVPTIFLSSTNSYNNMQARSEDNV